MTELYEALDKASNWATIFELMQLFMILITYCKVIDPNKLLEAY